MAEQLVIIKSILQVKLPLIEGDIEDARKLYMDERKAIIHRVERFINLLEREIDRVAHK